jgi:hypothetical protein
MAPQDQAAGNVYQRPLVDLLRLVPEHRQLMAQRAAGATQEERIASVHDAIAHALVRWITSRRSRVNACSSQRTAWPNGR